MAVKPGCWIVIPGWEKFQHYKDRDPKWIKLYNSLLHSDDYLGLSGHRRAILHGLWMAYASSGCELRMDPRSLSRRLQLKVTSQDLEALVTGGWMEMADAPSKTMNTWASRYISEETRMKVLARDGHQCRVCGSREDLEIDHVVPISKGGTGEISNLQTLCRKCNRSKHNGASVPDLSSIRLPREEEETDKEGQQGLSKSKTAPPKEARPQAPPPMNGTYANELAKLAEQQTLNNGSSPERPKPDEPYFARLLAACGDNETNYLKLRRAAHGKPLAATINALEAAQAPDTRDPLAIALTVLADYGKAPAT